MAGVLQHLRSSTLDKRPNPASMVDGQIAINYADGAPGMFFKDSNGALVKVGPVHVGSGAPNASPASGGTAGNSIGEQWLDTSGGKYVFKIWDGSQWRSEVGEFVNSTGDTMTGALVMDNQQQVRFRETTSNGTNFIAIQAPASVSADRTLTLPDVTGILVSTGDTGSVTSTMIADGTIVNGDINASAAIDKSKISGTAITAGDTGTVTSTMIADGTIVNGDINASAAIAGTKINPDFGSQNVTTTGTATAASLIPTSSTVPTNGVYLPSANTVGISSNSTKRLEIDASGNVAVDTDTLYVDAVNNRVGVGTTSPAANLEVVGTGVLFVKSADASRPRIIFTPVSGGAQQIIPYQDSTTAGCQLAFHAGGAGSEASRIDSSGRLLVGTSSARSIGSATTWKVQIEGLGTDTGYPGLGITNNSNNTESGYIVLAKSRGTSLGSSTIVQSSDYLGVIAFAGADGTDIQTRGAEIRCEVDGTPGANDMPGRLIFSTTADGASTVTERMRITNNGDFGFNKSSIAYSNTGFQIISTGVAGATVSGAACFFVNRLTNDGVLVEFYQADVAEGTISVSGTTVSYNGAHLSRWSQLPSGAERTEILRGTVLSNIDEMCEWGDEDNEQLNRMKVSDVEGDKNVSGVFQAWDDDDDTYINDFYCAMTGDFIIRIGAGVSVERGDLLMSAGDGTAKPQDDDIIRSKTIAKVTSTSVSCTYDDGSYCVPCVLMAC